MISQTLNEYAIKSVKTCLNLYACKVYNVYQAVFVCQQIFSLIYFFSDFYDQNYNNAALQSIRILKYNKYM